MLNPENGFREDVAYVFSVFEPYLDVFSAGSIRGANICELGPGANLGIALLFKCLGAANVYAVDKYLKPWRQEYHPPFYRALAKAAANRYSQINIEPLLLAAEAGLNQKEIHVLDEDAEHLAGIPDNYIDFCCSWAVLEHLYNPPLAFESIARITKTGGWGLHQVDFRDHACFERPLEFLLHDYRWGQRLGDADYAWAARRLGLPEDSLRADDDREMVRRFCGYMGNSYRSAEYSALWQANDFSILEFACNMETEPAYLADFMPRLKKAGSHAAVFSEDELKIISGKFVVRKTQDTIGKTRCQ